MERAKRAILFTGNNSVTAAKSEQKKIAILNSPSRKRSEGSYGNCILYEGCCCGSAALYSSQNLQLP